MRTLPLQQPQRQQTQVSASNYGIDWDGPAPDGTPENIPNPCAAAASLPQTVIDSLKENFDPLRDGTNFGIDCYIGVRQVVHAAC